MSAPAYHPSPHAHHASSGSNGAAIPARSGIVVSNQFTAVFPSSNTGPLSPGITSHVTSGDPGKCRIADNASVPASAHFYNGSRMTAAQLALTISLQTAVITVSVLVVNESGALSAGVVVEGTYFGRFQFAPTGKDGHVETQTNLPRSAFHKALPFDIS